MYFKKIFLISSIFILLISSCSKDQTKKEKASDKKLEQSKSDSNSELSKYELSSDNPQIIVLPNELKEISGITMTPDGRMFAQQDESGIIYQIEYTTGSIIKKFTLGNPPIKKDFEDIAYANNMFYLIHSNGDIYEFNEGENGESVNFKIYKTGLAKENDIEGMTYDSASNSLLLSTKGTSGVDDNNDKAVYSFSLSDMKLNPVPRFLLKRSEIKSYFNPSGIQRNPFAGSFFIIAANGNEIVEISKDGIFLGKEKLIRKFHAQPEGITFSSDGTLFISNEGKDGKANIVVYPLKK